MILITAGLYNRTDERADAVTPLPMMAATSANFGRVGAAALMMAMRNCLSAASSQTILFPSDCPEGMAAYVTFWVGGWAGRLWCALKFSCGGDLKSRACACVSPGREFDGSGWKGRREEKQSKRRESPQKRSDLPEGLRCCSFAKDVGYLDHVWHGGRSHLEHGHQELLVGAISPGDFVTDGLSDRHDGQCYPRFCGVGSEVMFVCVVEREERLGMMARERSRRKAERGEDS